MPEHVYMIEGTVTLDTGTRGGFRVEITLSGEVKRWSWVIQHSGREPLGEADARIANAARRVLP